MKGWSTAAVGASLQQHGFAVLERVDEQLLTALQAEAAAAWEQAEAVLCAQSESPEVEAEVVAQHTGCIFQVLPQLQHDHPARSSAHYWQLRSAWPSQQPVAAFLQCEPLVQLMQAVLGCQSVLLYNEQYIIKPPHANEASAFDWHYDSQYAGRSGRGVCYSPYLSLWVALDDMAAVNGCLVLQPAGRGRRCDCTTPPQQEVLYMPVTGTQTLLDMLTHQQLGLGPQILARAPTTRTAALPCGPQHTQRSHPGQQAAQPLPSLQDHPPQHHHREPHGKVLAEASRSTMRAQQPAMQQPQQTEGIQSRCCCSTAVQLPRAARDEVASTEQGPLSSSPTQQLTCQAHCVRAAGPPVCGVRCCCGGWVCVGQGGKDCCHLVGGKDCCHLVGGKDCCHLVSGKDCCHPVGDAATRVQPQLLLPPVGLIAPAGTAVLFWDDLWHCSGPNKSAHTRSAYMAQFCSKPLLWQDTRELVGLAVPLTPA